MTLLIPSEIFKIWFPWKCQFSWISCEINFSGQVAMFGGFCSDIKKKFSTFEVRAGTFLHPPLYCLAE